MNIFQGRTFVVALAAAFVVGFVPGLWSTPSQAQGAGDAALAAPGAFDAIAELNEGGSEYFKCRADCGKKAHEAAKQCLAAGGDRKTCGEQAKAVLDDCIATACAGIQPPCRLGCAQTAQAAFKACVDAGGAPKDCAGQARESLKACVAQCPPPPWACHMECHKQGDAAYRACRANSGDRKTCADEAAAVVKACVAANCASQPNPAP